MAWVAIGGAAIGVVGSAVISNQNNKAADARAANASASAGNNPVTAADPFADQRFQYQNQLKELMTGNTAKMDPGAQAVMNGIAMGGTAQPLANDAAAMLKPGYEFNSSDPSYAWRLSQGMDAVNRGAAKSGLLDSGNRMIELMNYGQGAASQEFGAEYARKTNAAALAGSLDQQHFTQAQGIDANTQNMFANNYNRLAQLSGANSGSQAGAGQIMAGQQAGAAAQTSKWGDLAMKAGGKIWDLATDGGGGTSSSNTNVGWGTGTDFNYTPTTVDANAGGALTNVNW